MLRSVVCTEVEDDARQNVLFYEILCGRTTLYQQKINYERRLIYKDGRM
ncbi:hypothetical protein T01_9422 [Trichinella spiralis]|uniref:Uncharacterized protein n=1 Tax=Trichinella spiralis TaxID=6334 RepID=A0A0V0ZCB9_TRISP|nr:hypothetical protein T01_9422 [Trichinella spiralis]